MGPQGTKNNLKETTTHHGTHSQKFITKFLRPSSICMGMKLTTMVPGIETSSPFGAPRVDSVCSDSSKTNGTGNLTAYPLSVPTTNSSAPVPDISHRPQQSSRTTTTSSTSSTSSRSSLTPVDALSRQYPAPTKDITVEEMLARPPPRWSLGHYVRHAREARTPSLSKEQQAKEFADVKRELLVAKERLKELKQGGR